MTTTEEDGESFWSAQEKAAALDTLADLLAQTYDAGIAREDVHNVLHRCTTGSSSTPPAGERSSGAPSGWRDDMEKLRRPQPAQSVGREQDSVRTWKCSECGAGMYAPDARAALRRKRSTQEGKNAPKLPVDETLTCQVCGKRAVS